MAWLIERNWRMLAACRSIDPDLFFPVSSAGKSLEQVAEARAALRMLPGPASVPGVRAADPAGARHLGRPNCAGARLAVPRPDGDLPGGERLRSRQRTFSSGRG